MSASNLASPNDVEIAVLLNQLNRFVVRSNLITAVRFALIGSGAWIGFMLVAMVLDYLSEMSASARWLSSRGSAVVVLATVGAFCLRSILRTSKGPLAFQIDESQGTGGQITTGWDLLRSLGEYDSPLSAGFAMEAIRQSIQRLSLIPPASVLPLNALGRPAFASVGMLSLLALCSMVFPPLAWNQFKRFAFPASETPPFTGIDIALDETRLNLRYGEDVKIMATVSRRATDRLELVTISKDKKERVLPMLPRGKAKWQALLTEVKEPMQYFARSGRARSETGELDVQLTPRILEVIARITPLSYTGQAVYEVKVPDASISGLAGTQIELLVTSNRPLKLGRMQIQYDDRSGGAVERAIEFTSVHQTVPLPDAASDRQAVIVSGSFELVREGKFEISVVDIDGLQSTESVHGQLAILADHRPIVRILEPKQFSLATPDIELPVSISAEDDFGITKLQLYRSLNGSAAEVVDLPVDESARVHAFLPLPLKQYGLAPGDEIDLFARTEDNDPNGPKGSESPKTRIRIISVEEFQERMLEQRGAEALAAKYEAAQRQLDNVSATIAETQAAAERTVSDPDNESLQQELLQKLQAAVNAAVAATKQIDKLAQNPLDIDIDRELSAMLKQLAEQTNETAQQMKQISHDRAGKRPLNEAEQAALHERREKTKSDRDQLQDEAINPLNVLSKTLPLMQDNDRFEELVNSQKGLVERMQSLADTDPNDPSNERRMMEMEAAQEQLRQDLNELTESIEANAAQVPDTQETSELKQSSRLLAQGIKQSGAPELMNDAQKSLLKSMYKLATEKAKAAADSLEALLPESNLMGDRAEKNLQEAFQNSGKSRVSKLGRTLEQLKQRMDQKGNMPGHGQAGSQSGEPGIANNGFATGSPSQQNIGLYGSMPTPSPSSRGRSDKVRQGSATQSAIAKQANGKGGSSESQSSDAAGQSQQNVPTQYRQRVSEYYRRINEMQKPSNRMDQRP